MRRLRLVNGTEAPAMTVRIAFASADRRHVDQHFGAARAFVLYELDADEARLVEAVEFMDAARDGFEGTLAAKIDLLHGCAAVYCNAAGASAIRRLLARGIQPLKVEPGTAIEDLLQGLQASLAGSPPAWLARRIGVAAPADRFEAMAAEGWQE